MVLVVAQAVAGPVLLAPQVSASQAERACPPVVATEDEVVVCGRSDQEAFRLRPLPPRYVDPTLPKAEAELLGAAKAAVEAEDATVGGFQSNWLMFRLKMPF